MAPKDVPVSLLSESLGPRQQVRSTETQNLNDSDDSSNNIKRTKNAKWSHCYDEAGGKDYEVLVASSHSRKCYHFNCPVI